MAQGWLHHARNRQGAGCRQECMRSVMAAAAAALVVVAVLSVPARALGDTTGDERTLELVTPAEPVGASVAGVKAISADGTDVVYASAGPMPGARAGDLEATNLAARGADGWANTPLSYPYATRETWTFAAEDPIRPVVFDSDFEPLIWVSPVPLVPGAPPEDRLGIYRAQPDGALSFLADAGKEGKFIAASEDGSRVLFSSESHLLPADAGRQAGASIYEVDGSEERIVEVDSAGNLISTCGSESEAPMELAGDRFFFVSHSSGCASRSLVYMWNGHEAVDISASQCTRSDCDGPARASFVGATPNGSSVFLVSEQQLTNEDHDESSDLYRYDVRSGALSLISTEIAGATGSVGRSGPVRVSWYVSVYFTATGRLLPGQGSEKGNLYFADASGLHLVAPTADVGEFQISQNGHVALFETPAGLEAGDTDGRSDVYLWSASTGTLTRLSKGKLSDNGEFDARIVSPLESQAVFLEPRPAFYRALTDDGGEAFFSTAEQLLPQDRNEVADVYGWSHGELSLISSGTGSYPAEFAGASSDGRTVLFKTAASLLPADQDGGARDLYAARLGGGFPSSAPAAPPAGCGDGGCPPTPRSRLSRQAPESTRTNVRSEQGRLDLRHVDKHAGIGISRGRPLKVWVRVPAPGRVVGEAKMRAGGRSRVAARGVTGAIHAGGVLLSMHVTPAARARLRRLRVLRVRLILRQGRQRLRRELTVRLGRSR